ncbi:DUF3822 family protein [Owenweeksia hongkongensis]|uniref:DUF3822 family protein n=1 Tax=Owenweeksia hongkongensis TaxID=253245 RepID=UPI003A90AB38
METGNNFAQAYSRNNIAEGIKGLKLTINLRYDGLAIVVSDPSGKGVLDIFQASWLASKEDAYLIEQTQKFFDQHHILPQKAAGIHWLFSVSKCSLIPDIFHQQGQGHELLSQTSRLEENETVYSDFWKLKDIVGLYALSQKLHDWAIAQNEKSTIAHSSFALNNLSMNATGDDFNCLMMVSDNFAELFITKKGKMIFYNQFPFDVHEDLLYYLLFALEQNRILAPEVKLKVGGAITKGSELYNLLSTYIGKVTEVPVPIGKTSAPQLSRNQLRQVAHLIASL